LDNGFPLTIGEPGSAELEAVREKLKREQQLVIQLEKDLQNREMALQLARYRVQLVSTAAGHTAGSFHAKSATSRK
jgi:hypothetical protein